jgi:hypothetical protein
MIAIKVYKEDEKVESYKENIIILLCGPFIWFICFIMKLVEVSSKWIVKEE